MAHIEELGGGSSRNVSIELNLVPFIDLMSVCIIFLLITAVWTQVSMIQLGSSLQAKKTSQSVLPKLSSFSDIPFRVSVLNSGFRILIGTDRIIVPLKGSEYDTKFFVKKIKQIKMIYPSKIDAIVAAHNNVKYEYIILAMDVLLNSGFSNVTISTEELL